MVSELHYPRKPEAHYSGLRVIDQIDRLDVSYRDYGYINGDSRGRAAYVAGGQ